MRLDFESMHELSLRLRKENFPDDYIYVDFILTATLPEIQKKFDFALKGGTAIIKCFSMPAYRFSFDLDFSLFGSENARKCYKGFHEGLERFAVDLGFAIDNSGPAGAEKHREGGRIFILKLMDSAGYLKRPVKLSVSCIDESPCFDLVHMPFSPIAPVPEDPYSRIYPSLYPALCSAQARVLSMEELCAEKIRALCTRGSDEGWAPVNRDIVDLLEMERKGVLGRVLSNESCLRKKLDAIKGRSYWAKLQGFLGAKADIRITEEDRLIFIDKSILKEENANRLVSMIQDKIRGMYPS
jgi:predicted nucleotidyltransferase component of viral defense system